MFVHSREQMIYTISACVRARISNTDTYSLLPRGALISFVYLYLANLYSMCISDKRKTSFDKSKQQLNSCNREYHQITCTLFLHFSNVVSQFVDALFLLFKCIQHYAHRGLLQSYSFHFILQFVLYVPKPQRSMDKRQQ